MARRTKEQILEDRLQRLQNVEAGILARTLVELAATDSRSYEAILRLTSTSQEKVKRIRQKLAALKRSNRFYSVWEADDLADDLARLVDAIADAEPNPKIGVELLTKFFELDSNIFERCDDSNGACSSVFHQDASTLFCSFAESVEDKEWLSAVVIDLHRNDSYGARDTLIELVSEFLPERYTRAMIERFRELAESISSDEEYGDYEKSICLRAIESLAMQLGDAAEFERTRVSADRFSGRSGGGDSPGVAACIDIACAHLEAGNTRKALEWLMKADPGERRFMEEDRDLLLYAVYGKLEETENQQETAWRIFRRKRSKITFQLVLGAVGEDKRDTLVESESVAIANQLNFDYDDIAFLLELGRTSEASEYLVARANQLNGDFYHGLFPVGKALDGAGQWLAATIAYRALLESILRRGAANAYSAGVRYLRRLDELAPNVADWGSHPDHDEYVRRIVEKHRLKKKFWRLYGHLPE